MNQCPSISSLWRDLSLCEAVVQGLIQEAKLKADVLNDSALEQTRAVRHSLARVSGQSHALQPADHLTAQERLSGAFLSTSAQQQEQALPTAPKPHTPAQSKSTGSKQHTDGKWEMIRKQE